MTCKSVRLLSSLIFFMMAMWMVSPAQARLACTASGRNNFVPDAGANYPIPRNAVVGTMWGSGTDGGYYIDCKFDNTAPLSTTSNLTIDLVASTNVVYSTNVYATNVPGIGVRYGAIYVNTINKACTPLTGSLTNGALRIVCTNLSPTNLPQIELAVAERFVVTSANFTNPATLTTGPLVTTKFTYSDAGRSEMAPNLLSGVLTGSIAATTCAVNVADSAVAVALPPVAVSDFKPGVTTLGQQAFDLIVSSCKSGLKMNVTLADVLNMANRGNVLTVSSAAGAAQGVGIQLLKPDGTPVSYGADSAVSANVNQWLVGNAVAGTNRIPLKAQYIRTTGTLKGGPVNAQATFTMSYQ